MHDLLLNPGRIFDMGMSEGSGRAYLAKRLYVLSAEADPAVYAALGETFAAEIPQHQLAVFNLAPAVDGYRQFKLIEQNTRGSFAKTRPPREALCIKQPNSRHASAIWRSFRAVDVFLSKSLLWLKGEANHSAFARGSTATHGHT
jgi:hypothetical protein